MIVMIVMIVMMTIVTILPATQLRKVRGCFQGDCDDDDNDDVGNHCDSGNGCQCCCFSLTLKINSGPKRPETFAPRVPFIFQLTDHRSRCQRDKKVLQQEEKRQVAFTHIRFFSNIPFVRKTQRKEDPKRRSLIGTSQFQQEQNWKVRFFKDNFVSIREPVKNVLADFFR